MQDTYQKVAVRFKERILEIWQSEETMKVEWGRRFSAVPFNRTDHWQAILYNLFRECWKDAGEAAGKFEPTGYDRLAVLRLLAPLLDYNIFSQILLNLQTYNGMAYLTTDAAREVERVKAEWHSQATSLRSPGEPPLDPFAATSTMIKRPMTRQENEYNLIISRVRSLKIISTFTPMISFRVSPMGSTPAFADSNNLSMLGMGADKYLRVLPQLEVYYLLWQPGTCPLMANHDFNILEPLDKPGIKGAAFSAPGIPYAFYSKSGGEVLHDVLFARKLMYDLFSAIDVTKNILIMLPRMNSVMMVADKTNKSIADILHQLQIRWPVLQIQLGSRVRAEEEAAKPTVTEVESVDDVIETCAKLANPIDAARIRALKGKFGIKKHEGDVRSGLPASGESLSSAAPILAGADGVQPTQLQLDVASRLRASGLLRD